MNLKLKSVQACLNVKDVEVSFAFYEKFGFERLYQSGDLHLVVSSGDVILHLSTFLEGQSGCQIMVEDVDAVFAHAQSLGMPALFEGLRDQDWGCRDFIIADPDGNHLTFSEHKGLGEQGKDGNS